MWLPEAGGFVVCPIYDRDELQPGNRIAGPAIVEQMDATTLVLPGMTARVDPYLNLILEAVMSSRTSTERAARSDSTRRASTRSPSR